MSTARYAAGLGAAALALGVSLGTTGLPGTLPVAGADTGPGAGSSDGAANPAGRPARAPRSTARSHRSAAPRAAAARSVAVQVPDIPAGPASRPHTGGRPDAVPAAVVSQPSPGPSAALSPGSSAVPSPAPSAGLPPGLSPVPSPGPRPLLSAGLATRLSTPLPSHMSTASTPLAVPVSPAAVAPRALAAVSVPSGAAVGPFAGVFDNLFGKIRALFEGAALLIRRNFLNEAPTVNPVQLTGFSDGPITGTVGAVDPEGDPLTYEVTGAPQYGTVAVTEDGAYTYTPGSGFTGSDNFVVAVTDTGSHINLLNLKRPKSTVANVAVVQGVQAPQLRFQFIYGAGSQFWSAEARTALESAASRLAAYFLVSTPVTVTFSVTGQRSPLSSTLASAGSDLVDASSGFMATVVQNKIQTGLDSNGSAADGEISWNFGPSWGFGDVVSSNQYDFQSTAMHELLHTLGFLSLTERAGLNFGQTWTAFDGFLVDSAGNPVIGSDYTWITDYNRNLTGGGGGLYFGGPNAIAAYAGPVPLYTPSTWSAGSSVSHLRDSAFVGVNEQLMTAVSGRGQGVRVLSPVELGVMADLGYQLNPGSGVSTLMFVGFFVGRRLRKRGPAYHRAHAT